jgi:hypothetical protein
MAMTDLHRLSALATLLAVRRDARLAALSRATAARSAVADRLAAIESGEAASTEAGSVAAAQQALRYRQWTAAQKITLNRELAARTAAWMTARDAAQAEVGRARAMELMLARVRRGSRDQES